MTELKTCNLNMNWNDVKVMKYDLTRLVYKNPCTTNDPIWVWNLSQNMRGTFYKPINQIYIFLD